MDNNIGRWEHQQEGSVYISPYHDQHPPHITIGDDDRETAYKRTAAVVRKIDEIRRGLELPAECMAAIIGVHLISMQQVVAEKTQAERDRLAQQYAADLEARTERLPLKIVSNGPVLPGHMTAAISRPQWLAFRIDCIEIEGTPSHWKVHEIRVGNKPQHLPALPELPLGGDLFRKGGPMGDIKLETLQTAMDFAMMVEYVGPNADGEIFEATAIGKAVRY